MPRRVLPPPDAAIVDRPAPAFIAKDWHDYFRNLEGAVTALEAAPTPGGTQLDFISGGIKTPAVQEYYIVARVPYAMTLTSFSAFNAAGTCTISLKITNVPVTGSTINVNTASIQTVTPSAANVAAVGQFIHISISAVAGSGDLWFTLFFTRTV